MAATQIDLLNIDSGLVVAPAGCGKTQLIVDAIAGHTDSRPILILTHTNAGVAALRSRMRAAGVKSSSFRLATIDGWAIKLLSTFPERSAVTAEILNTRPDYLKIRELTLTLLKSGHIDDVVVSSYSRILVDEYQDCSIRQHAIVYFASKLIPTCVLGDNMQAIFGFGNDPLASWDDHVQKNFPIVGELNRPWRWINADTEELGEWLLGVRRALARDEQIDIREAPEQLTWIQLDGTQGDHEKRLRAASVRPSQRSGCTLIIGESTSPNSQRRFASQIPGAVTVEAVDLRDLVTFARTLDLSSSDLVEKIITFAKSLMTNVGAAHFLQRLNSLKSGRARNGPNENEAAALTLIESPTYANLADLLVTLNKSSEVRVYRPAVLRSCLQALQKCDSDCSLSFYDAAVQAREENRVIGRTLPRKAVGSTLLLKGLEADIVVILDADMLNARNLYVALTRGCKQVFVCSRSPLLGI